MSRQQELDQPVPPLTAGATAPATMARRATLRWASVNSGSIEQDFFFVYFPLLLYLSVWIVCQKQRNYFFLAKCSSCVDSSVLAKLHGGHFRTREDISEQTYLALIHVNAR